MILYIAEKPSLGRAIADALPRPHKKGEGCIYVGNGDCVSWCVGHLLEQSQPQAYDPAYKQWRMEHLPIIPSQWQLQAKASAKKQLAVLGKLIKQAQQLVHAGDPDREGQLLVDQVLHHFKVSGSKLASIQRCLISDLNTPAVAKALQQLRPNSEFKPLSTSALARSRADWLYGINMTRAYTLQGRKVGYEGVLSVGRVQTPLLGLVVQRDRDIENFIAKPFYQVIAHIETPQGDSFKAKWQPSLACQPYQDEEGRVLSKQLAEHVVASINGQPALVCSSRNSRKKQAAPLPYNLSALQIDAAKRYGLSAQQVLDSCQSLYERHKLLTYPRSDNRYLPAQHLQQGPAVLAAIAHNSEALQSAVSEADPSLKSKAWNDSKVQAHHAIIPTEKRAQLSALNSTERKLYELVARQYIAQFYPPHEYSDSEIQLQIAGGHFIAKAKQSLVAGWKALFASDNNKQKKSEAALNSSLPAVKKGEQLLCSHGQCLEKQTTPPKPFDDASLLAAMTGIARYVQDPELKKVLKDSDGLGTEATRAGIIELLFKREFLLRQGKSIRASAAGKALINSLPTTATLADMTARWEMQLNAISLKEQNYQSFMQPLEQTLNALISQSQSASLSSLRGVKSPGKSFKKKTANRHNNHKKTRNLANKRAG
ncbi:DNA topoisomerase III [Dasania sp. GY-MA-18]|uniref:DNA topoisomerase 3 n=1 Tax=Dasania phycosphaerae TaxID=2950436 RepID=A0A9J6RN65_9GAMM|nr:MULTISPECIES: DNA topoisomerase III [Dasania]MCR8923732.1 DNA topoisomerase III [Dasania sp. GY-MA-18]MCZ0866166.1 DNA topoisomerase III [Dasania phycosphaerae]MCZ0869890.1 DNA topoisomerase III [Dasania phycosphaerae]